MSDVRINPPHVLAIHGIREGLLDPAWPYALTAHAIKSGVNVHVETEHYRATATPRWNKYVINPKMAKAFAARVIARREVLGKSAVHIVAHSNGTNIAALVAQRLAAVGIHVDTMVLIASALHSDVEKSGLLDLVDEGWVQQCVAYISPDDVVIKHLQSLPGAYGSLGARGFTYGDRQYGERGTGYSPALPMHPFATRHFAGFRHGTWFAPEWSAATYDLVLSDMGFVTTPY